MSHNSPLTRLALIGAIVMAFISVASVAGRPVQRAVAQESAQGPEGDGSLRFIENDGQFDPAARFQLQTAGATVWLANDAIWISALARPEGPRRFTLPRDRFGGGRPGAAIRLSFEGAAAVSPVSFGQQVSGVSYFMGNDPAGWQPNVPVWSGARYAELYPGISLELAGEGGRLLPRLVCATECGRLRDVRLRVDGAERITVEGPILRLETAAGPLAFPLLQAVDAAGEPLDLDYAPVVVNGADGSAVEVLAPFTAPQTVEVPALPDAGDAPAAAGEWLEMFYSTYLGGGSNDSVEAVAGDASGNAYLTGRTFSPDFPLTPGAFVEAAGSSDVFITKLNATGSAPVYSALIGGKDGDWGLAITVSGGVATVGGTTNSGDFPVTSAAFDKTCNTSGCGGDGTESDGFLVRLNTSGNDLTYATFLGGRSYDEVTAVGINGNAMLAAGTTGSGDFPTTAGAYDRTFLDEPGGDYSGDGFAVRLPPGAAALDYGTYFGGSYLDQVSGFALAPDGAATIVGATLSADFPATPGAYDAQHAGSAFCGDIDAFRCLDGFALRLNKTGSALVYSTFLGGMDQADSVDAVALNAAGEAFLTGSTSSDDFPVTPGAFDISHGSAGDDDCDYEACSDAFITRLNAAGSKLIYSTFLGGSGADRYDWGNAISVDDSGVATVAGYTQSANFPTTAGAFQKPCAACAGGDGFFSRLNPAGSALAYSTVIGGSDFDELVDLARAGANDWLIAGRTYSADYPTSAGALDGSLSGPTDGTAIRLQVGPLPANAGWTPVGTSAASGTGISATGGESSDPAVAQAPDGSLYLAWSEKGAGDAEIYVRRWNGASWVEVGSGSASGGGISNNSGDSLSPDIVATAGGVVVVWADYSAGDGEIYARAWDGSGWKELTGSASGGGVSDNKGDSVYPSADAGPKGVVVAWSDSTPGKPDIYVKAWDGKAWKEMAKGSASGGGISKNAGESVRPSVVYDEGGVPFVAWADNSSGDTEIYVKRYTTKWLVAGSGSATGGGISKNAGLSRGVALAAAPNGDVVAAWTDDSGGNLEIYVREWTGKLWREVGAGSASGRGISLTAGASQGASVAVGPDSNPFVAWYDASSGNAEIYVRHWDGLRWHEVKTGAARGGGVSDNAGASAQPALAVAGSVGSGAPLIVWDDESSGNYEIYARRSETPAIACYDLQLSHSGQGGDPVAQPAQSGSCPAGEYTAGTKIELTAAPAAGNKVLGWDGTSDDASVATTNSLVMPAADHLVLVVYGSIETTCYELTLTHLGQGNDPTASPAKHPDCPSGQYPAGTLLTLTAAPAAGWKVAEWDGTNNDTLTTAVNELTMGESDHTVTVIYEAQAVTCYRLSVQYVGEGAFPVRTPANSTGCAAGRYKAGEVVNLLARPASGWRLWRWRGTDNDGLTAGVNQITIPAEAHEITAHYRPSNTADFQLVMPFIADNGQ